MPAYSRIRKPRAVSTSYDARQVAAAYNYPPQYTGRGYTCGIIELGGGFGKADLTTYFGRLGLPTPNVVAVPVSGGKNAPDGPSGADGEVLLDIEVAAAVAPNATFRVYFALNTDAGFLAAIQQAAKECQVISISWGGPEDAWDSATIDRYDAVFAAARAAGVVTFAASGDTGSSDGESGNHVDFPASSPNVVGCGGTRLLLTSSGVRSSEVVWNDNPTSSATGGGSSAHFPGRDVPDVAGNADPATGYQVLVDGESMVFGGTSAVAPLYAGLALRLLEATGGVPIDWLSVIPANPQVCFDVTSGNNGAFRAGPGRDKATGFGVVDGGKLLTVVQAAPTPPPVPPAPPVPPQPTDPAWVAWLADADAAYRAFDAHRYSIPKRNAFLAAVKAWKAEVD